MGRDTATLINPSHTNVASTVSSFSPPVQNVGQCITLNYGAQEVRVDLFSRAMEVVFTAAIIFSTALMPFVLCTMFIPELMVSVMMPPAVYLLIPYILIMVLVGAKISSLFGCSLWERLTSDPVRKRAEQPSRTSDAYHPTNARVDANPSGSKQRPPFTTRTDATAAMAYTMSSPTARYNAFR